MILFEVNYIEPKKTATDFNKLGLDQKKAVVVRLPLLPKMEAVVGAVA